MKKINNQCKQYSPWLFFLLGVLISLAVMLGAYTVVRVQRMYHQPIWGGWVIQASDGLEEGETAPRKLSFFEKTVDIETSDGDTITCSYSIQESSEHFGKMVVIYDFLGKDVEFLFNWQPVLHIYGLGDAKGIWDADYLFAG